MNPKKKELKPNLEAKLKKPLEAQGSDKRYRRTDEEIKKEKEEVILIEQPNPLFIPILKIPFDAWAEAVKVEDLRLSTQETNSLALPVTQLVNYYLPKMPAIAYAWCGLVLSLYAIMQPRLKIIKELKKAKDVKPAGPESPQGGAPPLAATS
jgi:hypothetical protein